MNAGLPWSNPSAVKWVSESDAMQRTCNRVEMTLGWDAEKRPHEIRAAACMVILLGRPGLWWTEAMSEERTLEEIHRIAKLAFDQLKKVKRFLESRSVDRPELGSRPEVRNLLDSIDQELKILESRMSWTPKRLPQEPPCSWGTFW